MARMQHRIGPNVNGPFGLLQSLADGVKLALKEDIIPKAADKVVFLLAPGDRGDPGVRDLLGDPVRPGGRRPVRPHTPLQLTDMPVAVLFVMAIASIGIYGIVLGGWSSGSTYSLLGGLRSSAQMISYEVAMGLALVAVFLYAGSMSTSEIVAAQDKFWFGLILLPSFVIYTISMVGETNRAPFDLPEAEGELVGGFHTEYSSLKFALFFLAEYINMATVSALATTLFLGGWHAPLGHRQRLARRQRGLLAAAVVLRQGAVLHLHLHLAARLAAAAALRPVHGVRLEAADPGLAGLDRRGRHDPLDLPRAAASTAQLPADRHRRRSPCCSWCCSSSVASPRPTRTRPAADEEARRPRAPAASPCRRCPRGAPCAAPPAAVSFGRRRCATSPMHRDERR